MELKLIRTKKDYRAALAEVEGLWDAPAKSPDADRLDVLSLLIEQYEREQFSIADPDPIDPNGNPAMPFANFPITFAVAGATSSRSMASFTVAARSMAAILVSIAAVASR